MLLPYGGGTVSKWITGTPLTDRAIKLQCNCEVPFAINWGMKDQPLSWPISSFMYSNNTHILCVHAHVCTCTHILHIRMPTYSLNSKNNSMQHTHTHIHKRSKSDKHIAPPHIHMLHYLTSVYLNTHLSPRPPIVNWLKISGTLPNPVAFIIP